MLDFVNWASTVKPHKTRGEYVVSDRCGWIPGSSRTLLGILLIALKAYRGK